jgi:DNA repair exonuclease SbcCD nuclease subunit
MPTFLHAADLHIDSPLRGLADDLGPRVRQATRAAFRRLVDVALERKVSFVVLAGDIFDDAHQAIDTSRFIAEQLRRLDEAGTPVVLVRGNHDHLAGGSKVPWPSNVHELPSDAPATVRLDGLRVAIHGQSYPEKHVRRDLAVAYPPPVAGLLNVGVLHTALEGHAGEHSPYAPTTVASLAARGYAYWALGHVHRFVDLEHEGTRIVYPGNLQGRHVREQGAKGAALVTWEDQAITRVEHIGCDVLRWHEHEVDVADGPLVEQASEAVSQLAALTAADRAEGVDCAVRVTIRGLRPEALDEPRPRLEHVVREEVKNQIGDRVMLEEIQFVPACGIVEEELPAVLVEKLDTAHANLVRTHAADRELTAAVSDIWRKLGEAQADELLRALEARGVTSASKLAERALALGRQKLEARLSRRCG